MRAPSPTALPAAGAYVSPADPTLTVFSTVIICGGALFTGLTMPDNGIEIESYRYGAYAMLVTLAAAFFVESLAGVRSMIRVDLVALFSLYFLTFAEFLHPHVRVLYQGYTGNAVYSSQLVLIGMSCLAMGRHLPLPFTFGLQKTRLPELPPLRLLQLFFLLFLLGFLWVIISVRGNPSTLIQGLLAERFNRPWQRGAVGGWSSFLTELDLLLYPAYALGGYVLARGRTYSLTARVAVGALLVFATFFDVAEGSRNVVLIRALLFLMTYFIAVPGKRNNVQVVIGSAVAMGVLWTISAYMIEFRNIGLGTYLQHGNEIVTAYLARNQASSTFMLDNNLVSIARVCQMYPELYPFPGSDIVIQVFTKWVPRALWPDKPIDWSTSIESALGVSGLTIAVTYVGEAYLIAGMPSLIAVSILIGSLAASWNRVGLQVRTNLELVYYASGFFAAMLGMRSIQFVTIAIVPTVAIYIVGRMLAGSFRPGRPRRTAP